MRVLANTSIVFSLLLTVGIASAQQPAAPTAPGKQVPDSQLAQEQSDDEPATEVKTDEESAGSTKEKASYILGYVALSSLMRQKIDIDFDKFMEGIQTAHEGKPLGMGREEVMSVQSAFQRNEQKRIMVMLEQQTTANKEEGEKLMDEFAKQEGAQTIEDGVQYLVIKSGDGETPGDTDEVKIHYEGTYANGEVFDSSLKAGKPLQLPVSQFVPGFSAALKKMKVGDKWKVAIRGDRAYGNRPQGDMEPFKPLIFELELLEIIKK